LASQEDSRAWESSSWSAFHRDVLGILRSKCWCLPDRTNALNRPWKFGSLLNGPEQSFVYVAPMRACQGFFSFAWLRVIGAAPAIVLKNHDLIIYLDLKSTVSSFYVHWTSRPRQFQTNPRTGFLCSDRSRLWFVTFQHVVPERLQFHRGKCDTIKYQCAIFTSLNCLRWYQCSFLVSFPSIFI
jgi:hypothetical protein